MKKSLVIIPTYNERETMPLIIDAVLKHEGIDVLIVDDGSPDGTADAVKDIMNSTDRVFLIERPGKLGLGTAYVAGFKWGLARGYDFFFEMDADNSHDPGMLRLFLREMERGSDLVIGSRYLDRAISVVGWDFRRLLLSKSGNFYASRTLGLRLTDLTSGFRCYSRKALEGIDLGEIHSSGYAFQIEMAYRIATAGHRVGEIPIIFYERVSGASKMSGKIVREAFFLPWKLRYRRLFRPGKGMVEDRSYQVRTIAGFLLSAAGLAGSLRLGLWLSSEEGDIVERIHQFKMGLPGWVWLAMKIGLSTLTSLFSLALLLALAIAVFSGGTRK